MFDCQNGKEVNLGDRKFSYRRGTARRTMLANSCYVSRGVGVRNVSNSNSDLQGHSRALANGAIR